VAKLLQFVFAMQMTFSVSRFKVLLALLACLILGQSTTVFCQVVPARRIGVFSGTFSPPHRGHKELVLSTVAQFGLDEMQVIVNVTSDHKSGVEPFQHRAAMTRLMFASTPNVVVANPVLEEYFARGDMPAVVAEIQRQNPDAEIYQVMGDDSFERLLAIPHVEDQFRDEKRIIVVNPRQENVQVRNHIGFSRVVLLPFNAEINTSSTKMRNLIAARKRPPELPSSVWEYVVDSGLYADGWKTTRCEAYLSP
jgi:nicotinate-nucleotide adenylyltransferase